MNFHDTKWLSAQEWRLLRALEAGPRSQRQLRLALPPTDARSTAVQASSLSRSLRRLIIRGLIERDGKRYEKRTNG